MATRSGPRIQRLLPVTTVLAAIGFGVYVNLLPPVDVDCPVLEYAIQLDGASDEMRADVRLAFRDLSASTGIGFSASDDGYANVIVTWGAPAQPVDGLRLFGSAKSADRGLGGLVELNPAVELSSSPDRGRRSWYGVTLHELGHLLGLAHSAEPLDLMHPVLDERPELWSDAELEDLGRIGATLGCRGS